MNFLPHFGSIRSWIGWLTLGLFFNFPFLILANPSTPPNILFILVDDMGYGDPGCYNPHSKIPTPSIDRLAAEGLRFTDAHSSGPLCHPSRYGLMTGEYPFRIDLTQWPRHPLISPEQWTLPKFLQTNGYTTAMLGKWHLGFEERGYTLPLRGGPVDRGFDSFFGIRASTDIPPYFYIENCQAISPPTLSITANNTPGWSPIQGAFWREGLIAPDLQLADVLPTLTQRTLDFLHQPHSKPFFLYLAYPAPHTPWLPSPEFYGTSQAGLYGDFVVMVDSFIGKILQTLDDLNLASDTLVVFTSDNGPVWYPKDVETFGHDSSGGLRGMKGDVWENGHRIPFIMRWPQRIPAGSISHHTISFIDLFATLAGILGKKLPPGAAPDSQSFSSLLSVPPLPQPPRLPLLLASQAGLFSIRQGPWKYIDGLGSGGFTRPQKETPVPGGPTGQLYNLKNDPGETNNLFLSNPAQVERLRNMLLNLKNRRPE